MRVGCIGAGASGIYMAYMLDTQFSDFTLDIWEKNPEISGTVRTPPSSSNHVKDKD
jgi:protoporphyrinogen oxidase